MVNNYDLTLEIPEGLQVSLEGNVMKANGPKGEVTKKFDNPRLVVAKEGNAVTIKTKKGIKVTQMDKMYINSCSAHIVNMFKGVKELYIAKLKVCSGHFPMQVKLEGNLLQVKNFLGEKVPRETKIPKEVKVEVKGDIIEVTGADKDKVGQTAGSIEQSTRITNRDRRIFQDGCFIISKPGDKHE